MNKLAILSFAVITAIFGQVSIGVGVGGGDNYYCDAYGNCYPYDDDYSWYGPGWYWGVWYGDYDGWYGGHWRGHNWHHWNDGGHHGGHGGHGGHHGGGGHHH